MASNLPAHAPKSLVPQLFEVLNYLNNVAAKDKVSLRVLPFLFDLTTASAVF